jgi:hypothetical protein
LLVVLCGCRIGFEPLGTPIDGSIDAAVDAAPDAFSAGTITFGERPTSKRKGVTSDAYIDQDMPVNNRGGAGDLSLSEFNVSADHGLLRFDVSSIPPGTLITGARLNVTRLDNGDEVLGPLQVRLLGETWIEGTSVAGSGASWNTRDGSTTWTMPGGTTTQTLITVTPETMGIEIVLPPAVVQSWVDSPATNAGLLLTVGVPGAHMHLHSRESSNDPAARPELAVDVMP